MNDPLCLHLFELKSDLETVSRDCEMWETWTQWDVSLLPFEWAMSNEHMWYDGPIDIWRFGPFSLIRCRASTYNQKTPVHNII